MASARSGAPAPFLQCDPAGTVGGSGVIAVPVLTDSKCGLYVGRGSLLVASMGGVGGS